MVMINQVLPLNRASRCVVGSCGAWQDLECVSLASIREVCDMVEIRLDVLAAQSGAWELGAWRDLTSLPLLFTARRGSEGGHGDLSAARRGELLEAAMEDAALVDIEVASIPEMTVTIQKLRTLGVPWIASFHDFAKLPTTATLEEAARRAREAGAVAFKAAAMLHAPADIARLADFQRMDHGLPVATMGMGPLAAVSRLLCAQCGSVLNYGSLGGTPTAPGQWDAASLKQAMMRLAPFEKSV
jgi:3-dehydroquinate dehydratase I